MSSGPTTLQAGACGALVVWAVLGGCDGAARDPGLGAVLRVQDAQFVPGPMPHGNGGPRVRSAHLPHSTLAIGTEHERVSGALDPSATAVAIGRDHDTGFWIVTAGVPSAEEPELPSFDALLGLARDFPAGRFTLLLSAVDRAGHFGARTALPLTAESMTSDAELVVSLRWDDDADLDLHVLDPDGIEIWSRNINSFQPPAPNAAPADAGAWQSGGRLDFDSNAQCAIDGRDEEHVFWQTQAPSGRYEVRVVTASLCGEASAHWSLDITLRGKMIAAARGLSLPDDTRDGAGARSGARALSFVVP